MATLLSSSAKQRLKLYSSKYSIKQTKLGEIKVIQHIIVLVTAHDLFQNHVKKPIRNVTLWILPPPPSPAADIRYICICKFILECTCTYDMLPDGGLYARPLFFFENFLGSQICIKVLQMFISKTNFLRSHNST